jgi:hypothetical protein
MRAAHTIASFATSRRDREQIKSPLIKNKENDRKYIVKTYC